MPARTRVIIPSDHDAPGHRDPRAVQRGVGVPIRELLLVLCTAAVVTYLATGAVRVLAIRFGAVAIPRDRDVHVKPTPVSVASACTSAWLPVCSSRSNCLL